MSGDGQRAEETQRRGKFPTLAEKKKISPKTPGRELRSDKQRCFSFDAKRDAQQIGKHRISRKKGDVGNFHHLVIDRRGDRVIAARDAIFATITVVLDRTGVAMWKTNF